MGFQPHAITMAALDLARLRAPKQPLAGRG